MTYKKNYLLKKRLISDGWTEAECNSCGYNEIVVGKDGKKECCTDCEPPKNYTLALGLGLGLGGGLLLVGFFSVLFLEQSDEGGASER